MVPVTYANHYHTKSKRSRQNTLKIGFLSARLVSFLLLALLGLLYIAQTSQGAAKRVEVHSLRSKADELVHEQDQLQLEALRLQSLDTITQSVPQLQLEPVESVEYLDE